MLSTWQSYPDFSHLNDRCLRAPRVEHTIVYRVSNNDSSLWDNRMAAHLGYRPRDNAESFRAEVEAVASKGRDMPYLAVHRGDYAPARHPSHESVNPTGSAATRIRQ